MSEDFPIELAAALERQRAIKISESVRDLPIGGNSETSPTPFQSGYLMACEEILYRLNNEEWELKP